MSAVAESRNRAPGPELEDDEDERSFGETLNRFARSLGFGKKIPFIPQMESVECGAAALAMVLAYFGHHVALADLRQACGVSRDGSSALGIKNAAISYGLNVKALRVELEDLKDIDFPAILHWEFNHFVTLERVTSKGLMVVDPALGRQLITWKNAEDLFTGVVLTFSPGEKFQTSPELRPAVERYLSTLKAASSSVGLVVGCAILLEIGALVPPAVQQVIVDFVIQPKRKDLLMMMIVVLCASLITKSITTYLRERTVYALELAMDVALKTAFVSHLLRLPTQFFHQRSTGDLCARVHGNSSVRTAMQAAVSAMMSAVLVVGYGALMILYHWKLALTIIGITSVRIMIVTKTRRAVDQTMSTERAHGAREAAALLNAVSAPESLKAFGAESTILHKHANALALRLNASLERREYVQKLGQFIRIFDGCSSAAIMWIGGNAVIHDQMTIGVFSAFMTLAGLFDAPLQQVIAFIQSFQLLKSALFRIDDVMDAKAEHTGTRSPDGLVPGIRIDGVSFRYGPTSPLILDDVSLLIRPGETVAIVGRTGCGKSTLLSLIAGMSVPTEGAVRLDECDVRELDLREYRRRIGVVLQDSYFFNDTIRSNISLHDPDAPLVRIKAAARLACIDDVIEAMPDGYETMLGERGARMSGGQRQRLAIARALVHDPSILLLDEATSALDPELQAQVVHNLRGCDCTTVVIAHRLETVRHADRIVVLDKGQVVQQGRFQDLAQQKGLFREMLKVLA